MQFYLHINVKLTKLSKFSLHHQYLFAALDLQLIWFSYEN